MTLTFNDCLYALRKRYGIVMDDSGQYPQMHTWANKKYSIKLYKTYLGQIRLFVMPLDDIMNDKFYDIRTVEDIYSALDPLADAITVRQTLLLEAA